MKTFLTKTAILIEAAFIASAPLASAATVLSYTNAGDVFAYNTTNMAQQFTLGSTAYNLSTVSLSLVNVSDPFPSFTAGVYTDISGAPGTLVSSLTYLSTGPQENAMNVYNFNTVTFTGTGLLQANTAYWVGVSQPSNNIGLIVWYRPTTLGTAQYGAFKSLGTTRAPNNPAGLTITGTAVPEPSTYALFGLGALGLVIAYRRRAA